MLEAPTSIEAFMALPVYEVGLRAPTPEQIDAIGYTPESIAMAIDAKGQAWRLKASEGRLWRMRASGLFG